MRERRLCWGGSLEGALGEYLHTPELAAAAFQVLLGTLAELQSRGVFHNDVKPENILLRRKGDLADVVLADFGSAEEDGACDFSLGLPKASMR